MKDRSGDDRTKTGDGAALPTAYCSALGWMHNGARGHRLLAGGEKSGYVVVRIRANRWEPRRGRTPIGTLDHIGNAKAACIRHYRQNAEDTREAGQTLKTRGNQ